MSSEKFIYALGPKFIYRIEAAAMQEAIALDAHAILEYRRLRLEAKNTEEEKPFPKTRQELFDRIDEGWKTACAIDCREHWEHHSGKIEGSSVEAIYSLRNEPLPSPREWATQAPKPQDQAFLLGNSQPRGFGNDHLGFRFNPTPDPNAAIGLTFDATDVVRQRREHTF